MSLKGRTALVTGSTSGIGLGIAQALAAQGANIVFNGFGDAAAIEALQQDTVARHGVKTAYHGADMSRPAEIRAMVEHATRAFGGVDVLVNNAYHGADMSRPAEIRAMVEHATRAFGGVDVLVNNAGIQHVANVEAFPDDKWDAIIAINLSSNFHAIKAALPGMKQRGWGRIVNIASTHGLVASAQKSAYVAAKHGVIGLTKAVALETAQSNVTCNAICPGWVLTPLVQKQIDDRAAREGKPVEAARRDLLGEKQPSLEFVTPEQLGALTVFLCSEAASQVRGVAYNMDGGWLAQ